MSVCAVQQHRACGTGFAQPPFGSSHSVVEPQEVRGLAHRLALRHHGPANPWPCRSGWPDGEQPSATHDARQPRLRFTLSRRMRSSTSHVTTSKFQGRVLSKGGGASPAQAPVSPRTKSEHPHLSGAHFRCIHLRFPLPDALTSRHGCCSSPFTVPVAPLPRVSQCLR